MTSFNFHYFSEVQNFKYAHMRMVKGFSICWMGAGGRGWGGGMCCGQPSRPQQYPLITWSFWWSAPSWASLGVPRCHLISVSLGKKLIRNNITYFYCSGNSKELMNLEQAWPNIGEKKQKGKQDIMVLTHHHSHFPMSFTCLLSMGNFSWRKSLYSQRSEKMQKQRKAVKQDETVTV